MVQVCQQYMDQLLPADKVKFQTGNLKNNKPSLYLFADFKVGLDTKIAVWNLYAPVRDPALRCHSSDSPRYWVVFMPVD